MVGGFLPREFVSWVTRLLRPMNRLLALLACGVTAVSISVAQFEGIVESKNLTTDETGTFRQFTLTMWIKNDRIRVQTSAVGTTPASTMIYRGDRLVTWMLNDDDRTYFEILKNPRSPNTPNEAASAPGTPIKRTGKTRRILGYPCEQIIVAQEGQTTEIWGTKGLPALLQTIRNVLGDDRDPAGGWQEELEALGLFPLSASTKVEGAVVESQETTRIEQREIQPALFELPTGYRKQDVGQMGGDAGQ